MTSYDEGDMTHTMYHLSKVETHNMDAMVETLYHLKQRFESSGGYPVEIVVGEVLERHAAVFSPYMDKLNQLVKQLSDHKAMLTYSRRFDCELDESVNVTWIVYHGKLP